MDLIMLLFGVALVGVFVWLIITYIPMPPVFQTAITIIAVILVILFVLRTLGGSVPNIIH